MTKELFYCDSDLHVEQSEGSGSRLVGYAMKFGILSHDRGGFRDVFLPDVFGDSIKGTDSWDVKAYYDHDPQFERTGNHSEDGPISLELLLQRITNHIPHHIAFIEEKRAAF